MKRMILKWVNKRLQQRLERLLEEHPEIRRCPQGHVLVFEAQVDPAQWRCLICAPPRRELDLRGGLR